MRKCMVTMMFPPSHLKINNFQPVLQTERSFVLQSFWTFSHKKRGYSGVATFVRDEWSPISVELDSLGSIDPDLNGEGRCATESNFKCGYSVL